jgi:hypothetical protein
MSDIENKNLEPGDDIAAALAEFDSATKPAADKPADPPSNDPPNGSPPAAPAVAQPERKPLFADLQARYEPKPQDPHAEELAELRDFREIVSRWAGNIDSERMQARETADTNRIYAEANRIASEFPELAADFGKNYLRNEYADNPVLREAWDNRYVDDAAMKHARKMVDAAIERFRDHAQREAQRIRDIPMLADRDAVSAAVRGASKPTPPPAPPNFSKMTDSELREYTERNFGYRPSRLAN